MMNQELKIKNDNKLGRIIFSVVMLGVFIISIHSASANQNIELYKKIDKYIKMYGLKCANEKITDNFGNGNEVLYGTRNMRTVLYGIAYRGGANNFYHKIDKRDNHNPLPVDGLKHLCEQGFSTAVYLYGTNYKESIKSYKDSITGKTIEYLNITGSNRPAIRKIMNLVMDVINNPDKGPIYFHCWNGWHQSGLVSALILRQFCQYSPEDAYKYWHDNIDKVELKTSAIKETIESYVPFDDIKIDDSLKEKICPCTKR